MTVIYTRRVGEYEETFEGTAEEVAQVLNAVDSKAMHEAAAKIKPAPFVMVNLDNENSLDAKKIGDIVVTAIGKSLNEAFKESENVFDGIRKGLT